MCFCHVFYKIVTDFKMSAFLFFLLALSATKLSFSFGSNYSSLSIHPGAISAASSLVSPGKPPQLEDSYSPYNLMSNSESPTNPLVPPDSWGQGKSPNEKISNGTNINWPPGECEIDEDDIKLFVFLLSRFSWLAQKTPVKISCWFHALIKFHFSKQCIILDRPFL